MGMTLLLVEVDVRKIKQFPVEWIPGQIDIILEPYGLKWSHGNYYMVQEGREPQKALNGAIRALKTKPWLQGAVQVKVVRQEVRRRLEDIHTENMEPPLPEKLEQCRRLLPREGISSDKLIYPNSIQIDEENRLLDGYTTYLIAKEQGLEEVICELVLDTSES